MAKNGLNRGKFLAPLACFLLIAQLVVIEIFLLRDYIQSRQGIIWVIVVPVGLMTLSAIFYFYHFILRPLQPATEKKFVFSYFFLRLWQWILIIFGLIVSFILVLRLLTEQRQLLEKVFLALWLIANFSLFVSIRRQLKFLKTTEIYNIIDGRIKRAGYQIRFGGGNGGVDYHRITKLDLSNIHWLIAGYAIFMLVGLFLLAVFIIACIKGEWGGGFIVIPFLFSTVALAVAINGFLGLLETMLARPVTPAFLKKLGKPTFLSKPLLPNKHAFTNLFFYSFALIVLFGFSMGALMYAIKDWEINYESIVQFIIAIACSFIGFSVFTVWLEDYQKEKRKRKPIYDIKTIVAIQKGLLVVGHIFGYFIIIGGLILIHQLGATRFTIKLKLINAEIPWVSFLWGWLTLSELILFHQQTREFYPARWRPALIIRLTETIAKPFQTFPALNLLWLILKSIDLSLSLIFRLFGIPIEKPKEVAFTLPEAKSLAEPIALKRDRAACLFALQNGDEGINLNDQRAKEWRFSYYLPEKARQMEIVVAKGKAQVKRSKAFRESAPEKIPDDWIDPEPVIKTTQEALHTIFDEPEKESLTLFLHLPALRFTEVLGDEKLPEKPCWLISVFDTDMTFIQNYFIDPQTHQLLEREVAL